MPETPTPADAASASQVADGELQAAEQSRNTAKLIAAAIAAIPALGVASSIIRPPGDAGFDPTLLLTGLALVAIGVFVALVSFGNVVRPVALADKDLNTFDLSRIPGAPRGANGSKIKGDSLLSLIEQARTSLAGLEGPVNDATRVFKEAEATAAEKDAEALPLEALAKDSGDKDLEERARLARADANAAAALAVAARANLEGLKAGLEPWRTQFTRLTHIRATAIQLRSADSVRNRLYVAVVGLGVCFVLVAAGAGALALAPRAKTDAAFTPTLVTVNLSDLGKNLLGCHADLVYGIRTGGTDAAPIIITLPSSDCPNSKTFELKTIERSGDLGRYSAPTPIPLPSPTPAATPTASPLPTPT